MAFTGRHKLHNINPFSAPGTCKSCENQESHTVEGHIGERDSYIEKKLSMAIFPISLHSTHTDHFSKTIILVYPSPE